MDAESALADLTEISSQIESAVVFGDDGSVLASTSRETAPAQRLASTALQLLAAAADVQPGSERTLTQLEVSLEQGSVFVVRDAGRTVAATAAPGAPAGLVLYDLRACLRSIDEADPPAPRKRASRRKTTADA